MIAKDLDAPLIKLPTRFVLLEQTEGWNLRRKPTDGMPLLPPR
jgi:hypothetical protein